MSIVAESSAGTARPIDIRSRLVEALALDLVGPGANDPLAEERLQGWVRPSNWCLTGFLIPSGTPPEKSADADESDDFELVPETAGRGCARRLQTRHRIGERRRHQVTELPAIAAHITEYRCHRRQCPDCGLITLAPLPDEHATQFGPHLTALIAYLTVVCRMPRLVVQRFLEGALQIPISLGTPRTPERKRARQSRRRMPNSKRRCRRSLW